MPEIKLVPAEGRRVPMEDGRDWPLGEDGKPMAALVEDSRYYRRRIADEDLEVAHDDAAAAIGGVPPEQLVAPDAPAPEAKSEAASTEDAPARGRIKPIGGATTSQTGA